MTDNQTNINLNTQDGLKTEYGTAYQWRGFPPPATPVRPAPEHEIAPVDPRMYRTTNQENFVNYGPDAYQHTPPPETNYDDTCAPVDPDMYKTTNKDAFKDYGPDAYRTERPPEEEAIEESAPVDPDMYKTTNKDAFKDYGPDAYRTERPPDEEAIEESAPVDPDMYKTTNKDAFKDYGPDAYRTSSALSDPGKEIYLDFEEHASNVKPAEEPCAPTNAVAEEDQHASHKDDLYASPEQPSSPGDLRAPRDGRMSPAPSLAGSQHSSVAPSVRSNKSLSVVLSPSSKSSSGKPAATPRVVGEERLETPRPVSRQSRVSVRHVGPDHFVTTKSKDFPPPPPSAYAVSESTPRDSRAAKPIVPRHVNPDMYKTTSQEALKAPAATPSREPSYRSTASLPKVRADVRDFQSEYAKQFAPPPPQPVAPVRRAPLTEGCVHHVDPSFYTTMSSMAYKPYTVTPTRDTFTRPTVQVRHVDPSMYITSTAAAYQGATKA